MAFLIEICFVFPTRSRNFFLKKILWLTISFQNKLILLIMLPILLPIVTSYPSDPDERKRDIFLSRGWGASGMPFPLSNLNQHIHQQEMIRQQQLKQQQMRQKVAQTAVVKAGRRERPKATDDVDKQNRGLQMKSYGTIPQLFVSHGWGPMGTG
jgi:hypothetical protein